MLNESIRWRHLSAIMLLAVLTACGGGGGGGGSAPPVGEEPPEEEPPTVSVGAFVPGPVAGLHFETPTQSGLTSAAGEFQYREGETVTFSIGGIELGSAPAAAQVTLPELFGAELPVTEAGILAELLDGGKATGFDRVANAMMLLMALDADMDIGNGIDLGDWHAQLAGARMDFGEELSGFPDGGMRRLRNIARLPGNIDPHVPMYYLYEALGIRVAVWVQVEEEWDDGTSAPDGNIDYRYAATFNGLGLRESDKYDFDGDGNPEYRSSYTWDNLGRELSFEKSSDNDSDGIADELYRQETSWHQNGNLQMRSEIREEGELSEELILTYTHGYDETGNFTETESEDADGDGDVDQITTSVSSFDQRGNVLTRVEEVDEGADGTADSRNSHEYSYDAAGNTLSWVEEEDSDADGLPDTIHSRHFTYDDAGNRLTEIYERIEDAEAGSGAVDYKESETRTYDAAGNRTAQVREYFNGQGELTYEYTREAGFDDDDNLLFEESVEHHIGGNKFGSRFDYEYDTDGKLRETFGEKRTVEDDGSYRVESRYAYFYSYDEQGRITRRVLEFDNDADDTIDRVETVTRAYNEQGAMVSERYESDESNDGIADSVRLTTYDYQTLEQGVMHLIWWFGGD